MFNAMVTIQDTFRQGPLNKPVKCTTQLRGTDKLDSLFIATRYSMQKHGAKWVQ
ncbi:hypothetical protein BH11VER1_BH11VER1_36370 [soil metagenome]